MIPRRFRIVRPYLASLIYSGFPRPPFSEIVRWVLQPGKERRALRYVLDRVPEGEYLRIRFRPYPSTPFYYPRRCRWIDLCQTIDECFNPRNWHHFLSDDIRLTEHDVVVDCGAAEGLFTFIAAATAQKTAGSAPHVRRSRP